MMNCSEYPTANFAANLKPKATGSYITVFGVLQGKFAQKIMSKV